MQPTANPTCAAVLMLLESCVLDVERFVLLDTEMVVLEEVEGCEELLSGFVRAVEVDEEAEGEEEEEEVRVAPDVGNEDRPPRWPNS